MSVAPSQPIDPAVRAQILAELSAIETDHGVKILCAVESGSRAWGFPSLDSDYDVRFIYVRPVQDYLTVAPRRDVIERPIDATLDIGGWDIRKALQLLVRSNAVLLEWLLSPVTYVDGGARIGNLRDLMMDTADLTALAYHYDHLLQRGFADITGSAGEARLKTYCYALRAALASFWLRERQTPPPMDVPALLAGLDLSPDLLPAITILVDRKSRSTEQDTTARIAEIDGFIGQVMAREFTAKAGNRRRDVTPRSDALLASIILQQDWVSGR